MNIKEMTGEANYTSAPRMVLNEVLLNGAEGHWRKRIWVNKADDAKPEEEKLGDKVQVVFLKIRRKLVERGRDGNIARTSNEHNTVNDTITIFEEGKEVYKGNAKQAREAYPALRTVQVIYALLLGGKEPELVRLTLKGASLGSENRPKEYPDFYQYIGSFGENSIVEFVTELGVLSEKGKMSYYSATYTKGATVASEMVQEPLLKVHTYTTQADNLRAKNTPAKEEIADDAIQYPEEDINPEDIPF
jgi:hypothetical protein